ncbi:hypothetical protein M758_10G094200 [Ceratodon purpureus]|uniref:Hexosyltransferase n=1 Tax=Ceratodon purpureus TaxID=3225 RepID=A0A8T0GJX4_CERPU|nr:hypothetical protein KC19_10G095600 [Ceratodon purpureus]KAG0603437.1 hypothetical protein M758_10G094200 [Ceratodon purpureus]
MKQSMGILGVQARSAASPIGERCRPFLAVVGFVTLLATVVVFMMMLAPSFVRESVRDLVCESPATAAANREWVLQQERNAIQSMLPTRDFLPGSVQQGSSSPKNFSILLGVFSTASRIERRNIIRMAYGVQSTDIAQVTIRFIVGRPKTQSERLQLGLESLQYRDLIVLDMDENMNKGKTWRFYSTVAAMGVHFDYVMKVDDDAYVRIDNLASSLAEEPRTDLYYGYILPCENEDPYAGYMAGMGYIITWDLVEYISDSPIVREQTGGYSEDRMTGDWLDKGGKAKNRVNKKPLFYDHPAYRGRDRCTHPLVPETILIHQVKTTERWMDVLQYFEGNRVGAGSTLIR